MRASLCEQRRWPTKPAIGWSVYLVALLFAAGPAAAADTGLVVLKNGDQIRGEVKSLRVGKLELSTTSMGTVYVEWDKVLALTAPEWFEVELTTGARFYGTLGPGPHATLGITLDGRTINVDLLSVVKIRPLKQSFWSRLDGSVSLGASYTESSGIGQGSLSASVGTRRPKFEFSTKFDTTVTVQPNEPQTTRTMYTLAYNQLLPNRWFVIVTGKAEHNTDLGLQLRAAYGGGAGRYLRQTNRSLFSVASGFTQNLEVPVNGDRTTNVEAFAGAKYSFFTYDTPKTSFSSTFLVYPSLNVGGRVRTDADVTLSREIVSDFTVGLTFYDSFDNKPPGENATKHDAGVTLSIGWVF
ncbi:MAG: DUF481 domain-containing protein [Acidobacteria bacterium]|nr:DUF481 domain-containing protein [Acidobacteriota bacterium]